MTFPWCVRKVCHWKYPPTRTNSHLFHYYSIFSRESPTKPPFTADSGWGGRSNKGLMQQVVVSWFFLFSFMFHRHLKKIPRSDGWFNPHETKAVFPPKSGHAKGVIAPVIETIYV